MLISLPSMREWCRGDDFCNARPLLLRCAAPQFDAIRRIARQERGALIQPS